MLARPLVIFKLRPGVLQKSHPPQVIGNVQGNALFCHQGAHGQACIGQINQVNLVFAHLQGMAQILAQQFCGQQFVGGRHTSGPLDGDVLITAFMRYTRCPAAHQHSKSQTGSLRQHGLAGAFDGVDLGGGQAHIGVLWIFVRIATSLRYF
jgi:hypothetical protein